ncbi:MAG: carotenoid biosynthesis protein [Bacteroidales bacterium]|nr:carotenoid biosynthesis protein [Bacteroidales bacterium]
MGTNYKKILSIIEYNELPKTFAIFYSVGLLLFAIPLTRPLFLFILPLSLLFVFAAVLYHHKRWDAKFIYFGISVATLSFLIEMAGVKTGLVFGIYSYKGSLGAELLETPLMIGLNWFMLTYCSAAIMTYVAKRSAGFMGSALKATGGALLMLGYDFVAELVAPVMNMWEFQDMRPPAENYVMWFALALTFHITLNALGIQARGKPAMALFLLQMVFFLAIYIYYLVAL